MPSQLYLTMRHMRGHCDDLVEPWLPVQRDGVLWSYESNQAHPACWLSSDGARHYGAGRTGKQQATVPPPQNERDRWRARLRYWRAAVERALNALDAQRERHQQFINRRDPSALEQSEAKLVRLVEILRHRERGLERLWHEPIGLERKAELNAQERRQRTNELLNK